MRTLAATLAGLLALAAAPLSESTTASGLKEALRVATALRGMGMGAQVDELEVAMNRAAEKSAREVTLVFAAAISQMSFKDASGIVSASSTTS
jgi:hypothetical protein